MAFFQPEGDGLSQAKIPTLGGVTVKAGIGHCFGHDLDQGGRGGQVRVADAQVDHGNAVSQCLGLGGFDGGKQVWRQFVQSSQGVPAPGHEVQKTKKSRGSWGRSAGPISHKEEGSSTPVIPPGRLFSFQHPHGPSSLPCDPPAGPRRRRSEHDRCWRTAGIFPGRHRIRPCIPEPDPRST
jgi:hypothetical protein